MDHPSFSIGIIQIVTTNTNQIFDYEDLITMAKQSSKKSKAKKEAHAKTPKKSGRRVAPTIFRSAIPTYALNKAKTEYVSDNDDLQGRRVTTFHQQKMILLM
ncbi:hypothetical protein H5410_024893 [Solanum commersonii]|uniref:Uncharacterized protein n=1 Tax=Solanum commersonii TaxID=4109 RepID=A0A9J5ZND5_SOLCO|nr:hypothetical protein H5410_024893 [Solanum commersonii]